MGEYSCQFFRAYARIKAASNAAMPVFAASILLAFFIASMIAPPAQAVVIEDHMQPGDPFYEPIYACYKLGILKTDSNGSFRLDQTLSRYQVAHTAIQTLEMLGVELPGDIEPLKYPDVPGGHWAYREVSTCVSMGLMGGFGDLTFQGRSNMLKEHWLAMSATLALKFAPTPAKKQAVTPPKFRDLPTLNWLWDPINTLGRYGWLDPDTLADDFLNRNDMVTRRLLYWYLGKLIISRLGPSEYWDNDDVLSPQGAEVEESR